VQSSHSQRKTIILHPQQGEHKTVHLHRNQSILVKCRRSTTSRHRKVRLRPGDTVRIRCGNISVIVTCGRPFGLLRTITIQPHESIVVSCGS
jgi:hypothetical protein